MELNQFMFPTALEKDEPTDELALKGDVVAELWTF